MMLAGFGQARTIPASAVIIPRIAMLAPAVRVAFSFWLLLRQSNMPLASMGIPPSVTSGPRHLVSIADLDAAEIVRILDHGDRYWSLADEPIKKNGHGGEGFDIVDLDGFDGAGGHGRDDGFCGVLHDDVGRAQDFVVARGVDRRVGDDAAAVSQGESA